MKKLLLCASLLAVTVGSASAAPGLNLGWTDCPGGGTYALTRTFACASNSGTNTIVGTFVADTGLVSVTGMFAILDLQTNAGTLPAWWALQTGGCRAGSLTSSFDFTGGPATCTDFFLGSATGGISYTAGPVSGTPKQGRIKTQCALPAGNANIGPIAEGTEVYLFKCNINNAKTVNSLCTGCASEVCIVYNQALVTQSPGTPGHGNQTYTNPAVAANVIFQAWTNPDPTQACPAVTPAKNRTWGSIKSLYR